MARLIAPGDHEVLADFAGVLSDNDRHIGIPGIRDFDQCDELFETIDPLARA
jgi:hypothetical protein